MSHRSFLAVLLVWVAVGTGMMSPLDPTTHYLSSSGVTNMGTSSTTKTPDTILTTTPTFTSTQESSDVSGITFKFTGSTPLVPTNVKSFTPSTAPMSEQMPHKTDKTESTSTPEEITPSHTGSTEIRRTLLPSNTPWKTEMTFLHLITTSAATTKTEATPDISTTGPSFISQIRSSPTPNKHTALITAYPVTSLASTASKINSTMLDNFTDITHVTDIPPTENTETPPTKSPVSNSEETYIATTTDTVITGTTIATANSDTATIGTGTTVTTSSQVPMSTTKPSSPIYSETTHTAIKDGPTAIITTTYTNTLKSDVPTANNVTIDTILPDTTNSKVTTDTVTIDSTVTTATIGTETTETTTSQVPMSTINPSFATMSTTTISTNSAGMKTSIGGTIPSPMSTSSSFPTHTSPGNRTEAPIWHSTIHSHSATLSRVTESPNSITTIPSSTPTGSTANPTQTTMQATGITSSSTATTPPITTQIPIIVCPSSLCPAESICVDGVCRCLADTVLLNGGCIQAQVFPAQLHLTSLRFQSEMSNISSKIFMETSAVISAALRDALRNEPGYIRSDVLRLVPGSVQATVKNIFQDSNATEVSIDQAINKAIEKSIGTNGLLANATVTGTNLCEQEPFPCDVHTTICSRKSGRVVCSCKGGFISTVYSNRSCSACPSGQRVEGNTCQQCPFGSAGFNCNDSVLLAVVVISCVLGGVLLIVVLFLFLYCCWRRCLKQKSKYGSSPYPAEDFGGPWPAQGIIPIPRATTNWDTAPSIEMTKGGSTHALVDKPQTNGVSGSYDLSSDGMKTFKGKNTSRYSYLVQGHENPYFLPGDEKNN